MDELSYVTWAVVSEWSHRGEFNLRSTWGHATARHYRSALDQDSAIHGCHGGTSIKCMKSLSDGDD